MSKILDGPSAIEDLSMLLSIIDYLRPDLKYYPSLSLLAFTAGLSEAEADIVMRRLAEKKLVTYESVHGDRLKIDLSGFYQAIERLALPTDRHELKEHDYDE